MSASLALIAVMALITYATRVIGVIALDGFRPRGRLAAGLEAVPAAVLTAVVAPAVLLGGPPEMIAAGLCVVAALRLPIIAVVAIGVGAVVVLRALFG